MKIVDLMDAYESGYFTDPHDLLDLIEEQITDGNFSFLNKYVDESYCFSAFKTKYLKGRILSNKEVSMELEMREKYIDVYIYIAVEEIFKSVVKSVVLKQYTTRDDFPSVLGNMLVEYITKYKGNWNGYSSFVSEYCTGRRYDVVLFIRQFPELFTDLEKVIFLAVYRENKNKFDVCTSCNVTSEYLNQELRRIHRKVYMEMLKWYKSLFKEV